MADDEQPSFKSFKLSHDIISISSGAPPAEIICLTRWQLDRVKRLVEAEKATAAATKPQ